MLQNGLGKILLRNCRDATQFIDLFSGSGVVASFVAQNRPIRVRAVDLQSYSANLAASVIARTRPIDPEKCWEAWEKNAESFLAKHLRSKQSAALNLEEIYKSRLLRAHVDQARALCKSTPKAPVTRAYGGYYFSPTQALLIDALRATVPQKHSRHACLASLIQAASRSAAAPGHTAQPFQPTRTGRKWIHSAWMRDIRLEVKRALSVIAKSHAQVAGKAEVSDACLVAKRVPANSLVFVDPPYSAVHYSRFYHVLETISTGAALRVSGRGRYPSPRSRPRSDFSIKGEAADAVVGLLKSLSKRRAKVIFTFPWNLASNGLSGRRIENIARQYFFTTRKCVTSKFSTLGGYGEHRSARQSTSELILTLRPKPLGKRLDRRAN